MQAELFELEPEPEHICYECRYWVLDLQSDIAGMGECLLNIVNKRPETPSCEEFKGKL